MSTSQTNVQFSESFKNYSKRIINAIGFSDESINSQFQSFINQFSDEDKFKLINQTEKYVSSLEQVDKELLLLTTGDGSLSKYMNQIQTNWNSMNEQFVQLQILTIIQKKEDCSGVIKQLLNILGKKIETVNSVLRENLGISESKGGSTNQEYIKKYLKYKNKYLSLKN